MSEQNQKNTATNNHDRHVNNDPYSFWFEEQCVVPGGGDFIVLSHQVQGVSSAMELAPPPTYARYHRSITSNECELVKKQGKSVLRRTVRLTTKSYAKDYDPSPRQFEGAAVCSMSWFSPATSFRAAAGSLVFKTRDDAKNFVANMDGYTLRSGAATFIAHLEDPNSSSDEASSPQKRVSMKEPEMGKRIVSNELRSVSKAVPKNIRGSVGAFMFKPGEPPPTDKPAGSKRPSTSEMVKGFKRRNRSAHYDRDAEKSKSSMRDSQRLLKRKVESYDSNNASHSSWFERRLGKNCEIAIAQSGKPSDDDVPSDQWVPQAEPHMNVVVDGELEVVPSREYVLGG